ELTGALRAAGLESSQLVVGIDMSASNSWTGKKSYGRSLHDWTPGSTPYEDAITLVGPILENFDEDNIIPAFRFGDSFTTDQSVMPLSPSGVADCNGVAGVIQAYREAVVSVKMSGPTTMAPMIDQAIALCQQTNEYHILIILTDGDISSKQRDAAAVLRARDYPLSIIAMGLGDGPFDVLEHFDDHLKKKGSGKDWDNFQFVPFTHLQQTVFNKCERPDLTLATAVLQEVPEQFKTIKRFGLLDRGH
ncbi:hypothetical protein KIPB_004458, partial [Kipferlia bialata]